MMFHRFYRSEFHRTDPDVLILIDHVSREMEFAQSLYDELIQRRLTVEIVTTKFNFHRLPFLYTPSVVITPWAYSDKEMRVFNLLRSRSGGHTCVINLHFEQITNNLSESFVVPRGVAKDCLHLAWSDSFSHLLERSGVGNEQILRFGNPKLDVYEKSEKMASRMELSSLFQLDTTKRWILIAGNAFHLLNATERDRFSSNGVDMDVLGRVGSNNTKALFEQLPRILPQLTSHEIIYRPHPSFSDREMRNPDIRALREGHPNFHLIFDGSISSWVTAVDVLMSFHSTSYLEAVKAKTLFALLRLHDLDQDVDYEDLRDWPVRITNVDQMHQIFTDPQSSRSSPKYSSKVEDIERKYFLLASASVSEKLATEVHHQIENGTLATSANKRRSVDLTILIVALLKLCANWLSEKSRVVRTLLVKSNSYRLNNLAYMSGKDAFDRNSIIKSEL